MSALFPWWQLCDKTIHSGNNLVEQFLFFLIQLN